MKLTENHIHKLYKFTRQHYVEHYDVQTELVDHLANDIENIWKESPNLSFEEARDKSFKKFGVFGFMDVVEARHKTMTKKYWKILWRFVKEWFELPKVLITLTIFISFYALLQLSASKMIVLIIILLISIHEIITTYSYKKRIQKSNELVFLLEDMIGRTKYSFTLLTLINVFNFVNLVDVSFESLSIFWLLAIASVATIFVIASFVTSIVIPKKAEELLQETYPEYNLVKKL